VRASGNLPIVVVSIGNDRPIRVILDTGSVGLRVLASAVPIFDSHSGLETRGIETTDLTDRFSFLDGEVLDGTVAKAAVHVGGLNTTGRVPFQLVSKDSCQPHKPYCAKLSKYGHVVGVLGIGLQGGPAGAPVNPLIKLPPPFDQSWSIHLDHFASSPRGTLTLGAPLPRSPKAVLRLSVTHESRSSMPTWNTPEMCWKIAGVKQCGATTFDTGTGNVVVSGYPPKVRHPSLVRRAGRSLVLDTGHPVALYTPEPFQSAWTFRSGWFPYSLIAVSLETGGGPPTFNTGIAIFYAHTITFSNRDGLIAVS
jgi:hypothetical protein